MSLFYSNDSVTVIPFIPAVALKTNPFWNLSWLALIIAVGFFQRHYRSHVHWNISDIKENPLLLTVWDSSYSCYCVILKTPQPPFLSKTEFVRKKNCSGFLYLFLVVTVLFIFVLFNQYQFHQEIIGMEDKIFHQPVSCPVFPCFRTTIGFFGCWLYLVIVCYYYCYFLTTQSLPILLKNHWHEKQNIS